MPVAILVATPLTSFGELLRISLEESGQYQVRLISTGKEVKEIASRGVYQMAIVDAAINDVPFLPLCKEILELQKGIRLVVIPPENNVNHPLLGDLLPHGYISRPFYSPDLIDTVSRLLEERNSENPIPVSFSPTLPLWLQDPVSLQIYLEQELQTTQALAGMIGIYTSPPNPGALRIWAGQILPESAVELITIVFRYWNRGENTDLMRFIRLAVDKKDYLVYATRMKGDFILILAYDTKAPLSLIRPQTKNLAQVISTVPPKPIEKKEQESFTPHPPERLTIHPEPQPLESSLTSNGLEWLPEESEDSLVKSAGSNGAWKEPALGENELELAEQQAANEMGSMDTVKSQPVTQALDDEHLFDRVQSGFSPYSLKSIEEDQESNPILEEEGEEQEIPNLTSLLGSFPSPDPDPFLPANTSSDPAPATILDNQLSEWHTWQEVPEIPPEQPVAGEKENLVDVTQPTAINSPSQITPREAPSITTTEHPLPRIISVSNPPPQKTDELNKALKIEEDYYLTPEPPINPLEDTRPHVVASLTNIGQLEPISPALSQLNYTCVLLPRLPQHYLTGDLADRLAQWVQQLCLAYGWRLEGISIRPEYLQWTVQVAPSISPGNLVRIVRQRSSMHIFSQYAHLRDQNPSGDFWASGDLIVSGAQPPSAQLLREYISQTRKRQGVIK